MTLTQILNTLITTTDTVLEAEEEIGDREVRECLLGGPERCVELFDILSKVKKVKLIVPRKRKHVETEDGDDDEGAESVDEVVEADEEEADDYQDDEVEEEWTAETSG